ncbi:hypothetical protein LOTGIDRAFT_238413 [Lottia gigantea]|uniref:Uncharacterized protein n=1 Tax=Lottia gigantea TaxID=225164 RepID=V4AUE4_LOTGI|nr:hypothetical protein LOTGIDRAFT_238413 [Lottia gigantea]ESP00928.1 hypothetical protein LOTGIDRAFT_238413 [Lottia gigantea]
MKTIVLLSLLAIALNHVNGGELGCVSSTVQCGTINLGILDASTCEDKAPFFKCLRDKGCSRADDTYKKQVTLHKYERCGASAIIMGWTLPILMFTVAKYFSKN